MKTQEIKILYANPEKCLGCHSCEIACAVAHGGTHGLFDAVMRQLPLHSRTKVVFSDNLTMPMQCRQCDNAPCVAVCPTGAFKHVDGFVQMHSKNCIGCKLCLMVCPFGAITVCSDKTKKHGNQINQDFIEKCDLCLPWRAANGKEDTACVEACPTKAIKLVDMKKYREELIKIRARELVKSQKSMNLTF